MKRPVFSLLQFAVVFSFLSCTKTETVVQHIPVGEPFQLRADEYAANSYFVDTSYIPYYEPFYQQEPPVINGSSKIVEEEVWVQRQGTTVDPQDRLGVAWINLPPRPSSGYDSTYRTLQTRPGEVEAGRFYRLDRSQYRLDADGYLGVITFLFFDQVPDAIFAIAYRRADGTRYGDFLRDGFADTTSPPLVLKMIKPRYLLRDGPLYPVAWKMLLKNIYFIYHGHVSSQYFQLDVMRRNLANVQENIIQGRPLLNVLGLDRFNEEGVPTPNGDGQFDLRPGRTFMPNTGEIIFPSLRPFDTGITQYFLARGLTPPDSTFLFPELYDSARAVAMHSSRNRYTIRGRAIFD
jgi:hypothetical protein